MDFSSILKPINFLLTPLESIESTPSLQVAELENEIFFEEEINIRKEIFVNGAEITTLWSTAINLASELGVDKYQVMYALYEGNKDSFINNDINSPIKLHDNGTPILQNVKNKNRIENTGIVTVIPR